MVSLAYFILFSFSTELLPIAVPDLAWGGSRESRAGTPLEVMVILSSLPLHAWGSRRDNKAVAELPLMNENELLHEAMSVCTGGAGAANVNDAYGYLDTIGRVVRAQSKSSELPWWVNDMREAIRVSSIGLCNTIRSQVWEQQRQKAAYRRNPQKP